MVAYREQKEVYFYVIFEPRFKAYSICRAMVIMTII